MSTVVGEDRARGSHGAVTNYCVGVDSPGQSVGCEMHQHSEDAHSHRLSEISCAVTTGGLLSNVVYLSWL